ncbi:MAG TPA: FixH family protein [Pseudomonadales bacterium]|nr:FixH family protein [Pseudomonadales bacterium]
MIATHPALERPWYRHGWVWALIAIPASSVAVGIVMIVAAVSSPGDLVRDDYYRAGLAINQDLTAARRAAALGLEASLTDRGSAGLLLRVQAAPDAAIDFPDADLTVLLQHPTLAERDMELTMTAVAVGRWAVTVPRFDGVRGLRVRHPQAGWLLQTELRAPTAPTRDPGA